MKSSPLFTDVQEQRIENFRSSEKIPSGVFSDSGVIKFKDNSYFITCYSPLKMIEMGIFGNGYFGIGDVDKSRFLEILDEVPLFREQIDPEVESKILLSPQDFSLNKYGIKAGLDYKDWAANGWFHESDPYGWFNWYLRFYYGRRHPDDFRQINRFRAFVRRHWGMLETNCNKIGIPVSSAGYKYHKTCQGLLQWGWDHRVNPIKVLSNI